MRLSARGGFALPLAIGSMVVIGMMIAGVFFVATQENRVGRNTFTQEQAFRGAEAGLNATYGAWNNAAMTKMANGAVTTQVHYDTAGGKWTDTVRIMRLNSNTFSVVSSGYAGSGVTAARHRVAAVMRVAFPQMSFLGALTVRGAIKVGGSSYTTGMDSVPSAWTECPPAGAGQPGIATTSTSNITTAGCNRYNCIDGNPQIQVTSGAGDSSTYFNYGPDASWSTLSAAANIRFNGSQTMSGMAPAVSNGVCNTGSSLNWGDPNRRTPTGACESYFPIIYFSDTTATVHLTGGTGQGILMVDGDLQVDGGFAWFGPVIVRGHLTTQGTGGHFTGAVMAANVDLEQNTVLGNAIINYSSCALTEALAGAGIAKRLNQRGWTEMF